MADKVDIDKETKEFVRGILSKNNFTAACKVKYTPGSEVGDGYDSKTIAVDVKEGERSLHLFLKSALTTFQDENFLKIYATEVLFYDKVIPAYYKFLRDKGIEDGFRNVPKCYGVYEKRGSEILVLENLRKKNFVLFDRYKYMNDKHLKLILQAFAKFHAISFALKDQQRAVHDEFCRDRPNIFILTEMIGFEKALCANVNDFLDKLDPKKDVDILQKRDGLDTKIINHTLQMDKHLTEYAILTKGDCWVNNMMLLYEDKNCDNPADVMLIDWQGVTRASPVHDIQAFFYSVSSEDTVENYKYYLRVYHDELCKRIKELGSDPDTYPFSVFEEEWKRYGVYSLGIALFMVKMMLCKKENIPILDETVRTGELVRELFCGVNDDVEQYLTRGKYIIRHLIKLCAL